MERLDDDTLERSPVVANCRMNRERVLTGGNGYTRELGVNPLDLLREPLRRGEEAAWLDLCSGTGRALVEAARRLTAEHLAGRARIVGVDLVGLFWSGADELPCLQLIEGSVTRWEPAGAFDLITCVHGLHYIGDKLGLLARASRWLADGGLLLANVDLTNVRVEGAASAGRRVAAELRRAGFEYDRRRRLVRRRGRGESEMPFRYLGAAPAGPNSTGQPAVDSWYALDSPG